jgi:hypothetical protein
MVITVNYKLRKVIGKKNKEERHISLGWGKY